VTVAEVTDPFEEFDPSQIPPEGTRFVLVTLVFENPGDGQFFVEPSGLVLRDADGNLWSATSVSRPQESVLIPDIRNQQLAPGDRLSGAVIFAVPEGTGLAGLHTSPVSGQLVLLADLEEGAASGTAAPAGTPEAASDESTTTMAATACADLERWLTTTRERIAQAGAMSVEDATLADPASMAEHAAEYAALADAQLAEQAPPEADAAGKALAATLNAYGGSIEQILGATEPGKDTVVELTEGMNTFNDAGERIRDVEDELARIASGCGLS
jgi:hypothetical protein